MDQEEILFKARICEKILKRTNAIDYGDYGIRDSLRWEVKQDK